VAFADLIPLIGATLGAVPTVGLAFLHSVPAGIGMIIVYVVYQQFENHVLQVTIMARTVKLSPLAVLVSLLIGVQLFGLLGALLAIPAAGIMQVITTDLYRERQLTKSRAAADDSGERDSDAVGPDAHSDPVGSDDEADGAPIRQAMRAPTPDAPEDQGTAHLEESPAATSMTPVAEGDAHPEAAPRATSPTPVTAHPNGGADPAPEPAGNGGTVAPAGATGAGSQPVVTGANGHPDDGHPNDEGRPSAEPAGTPPPAVH